MKLDELKKALADARTDGGHQDFQAMQGERAEHLLWELSDGLIAIAEAAQKVRMDEERFEFSDYFSGSWAANPAESDELDRDLAALTVALDSIYLDTKK